MLKKSLFPTVILLLFMSCSSTKDKIEKENDPQMSNRIQISPPLYRRGIRRSDLNQRGDIQIRRLATQTRGNLLVSHTLNKTQSYTAHECTFGYEKGQGIVHRNQQPYIFETISVSVTGRDQKGDDFFDRVSYTNADYEKKFSDWDFSRPFGPVDIDSSLRFGHDDIHGALSFFFNTKGQPVMELRHTDTYATARSHYFKPGEKRDYTIRLIFDVLNDDHIQLNSLELNVQSANRDRFGNYSSPSEVINVFCSNFQEV
jgi:hypothetical protein